MTPARNVPIHPKRRRSDRPAPQGDGVGMKMVSVNSGIELKNVLAGNDRQVMNPGSRLPRTQAIEAAGRGLRNGHAVTVANDLWRKSNREPVGRRRDGVRFF